MLIDYSYKYFYADGYGKESLILNLDDKGYDKHGNLYFTACLLSFYQQVWLWDTHRDKIRDFNIEKPLWVFVGNTVAGEDSDIVEVIKFLAWFLNHPSEATTWIADLVADKARLLDPKGNDVFAGRFSPLMQRDAATIYDDILKRLLNADARQRLAELLVALIGVILTVALPILSARIYRWTGVRIEEKHMKALHEAISTWAYTAVTRGVNPASREAYEDLLVYLKQSVPDALKALGPSAEVLIGLAGRYLRLAER